MKNLICTFFLSIVSVALFAQIKNPVQWTFASSKKSANEYEIVITASLPTPWHIYSQSTPKGGPKPTIINFKTNPLVVLEGKTKEMGELKTSHDVNFGVDVKYFSNKVEFVQLVKLKGNIKTNIAGTIEYMVCDDSQCLPPTKKDFDIKLQ